MSLLTLQTFLAAYKLDDDVSSSWWAVLTPSYVIVGFMIIILLIALFNRICAPSGSVVVVYPSKGLSPWKKFIFTATVTAVIISFVVLLAARIEENSSLPWPVVFIPIYVLLAVLLIYFLYYMIQAGKEEMAFYSNSMLQFNSSHQQTYESEVSHMWLCWVFGLTTLLSLIVLIVLVSLRIGSSQLDSWSYFAVFTPVWFYFGFMFVLVVTVIPFVCSRRTATTWFQLLAFSVVGCLFVVFFILLALNADGDSSIAWHIVFIPLYILELLIILYLLFRACNSKKSGNTTSSKQMIVSIDDDEDTI